MAHLFKKVAAVSMLACIFTACEDVTEGDPQIPTPAPDLNLEETQVNTITAGNQENARIATLSDGGWIIVWQSADQDGSGSGVFQQRFDRLGARVGGETQVNVYTANGQYNPQVTALSGGGWVVAWNSWEQDGEGSGVFMRVFSADGAAGSEQQVNVATALNQQDPLVAGLEGGGFVVYWVSQEADGTPFGTFRIYHRLYSAGGSAMGGERPTGGSIEGSLGARSLSRLTSGGWAATYSNAGLGTDVFQEAFNGTGSSIVSGARVNAHTENSQHASQVAALEGGGWVVTWESNLQDGSGWGIYQQRYNQNGQRVGGETQVNSTTTGNQQRSQVVGLEGGGWVVAFSSGESLSPALIQQAYSSSGAPLGTQVQVNAGVVSGINFHQLAALDGGGWVIAWQAGSATAGNINVYQQIFDASGSSRGSRSIISDYTSGPQFHPRVTAIENGWVAVWQSTGQDGSGHGVFMKVFQLDSLRWQSW